MSLLAKFLKNKIKIEIHLTQKSRKLGHQSIIITFDLGWSIKSIYWPQMRNGRCTKVSVVD